MASSMRRFLSPLVASLWMLALQLVCADELPLQQVAVDIDSSITIDVGIEEEPRKATGFLSTTKSDADLEHNMTAEPVAEGSAKTNVSNMDAFDSGMDSFMIMFYVVFGFILVTAVLGIVFIFVRIICGIVRGERPVYYLRRSWSSSSSGVCPEVCDARVHHDAYCHSSAGGAGVWRGDAMCDGCRAADRANWLQANEGLSMWAAQQRVMNEFPHVFSMSGCGAPSCAGVWRGDAMCDGHRAADRAQWLQVNEGLSMWAAQQRVMNEFPHVFGGSRGTMGGQAPVWLPGAMCDGTCASERAQYLEATQGMTRAAAQMRVMSEYPYAFRC